MSQNEVIDPQIFLEAMSNKTEVTPPRVTMAFNCICWARTINQGQCGLDSEGNLKTTGRPLQKAEAGVYNAALDCLRVYLNGEMFELPNFKRMDNGTAPQDG